MNPSKQVPASSTKTIFKSKLYYCFNDLIEANFFNAYAYAIALTLEHLYAIAHLLIHAFRFQTNSRAEPPADFIAALLSSENPTASPAALEQFVVCSTAFLTLAVITFALAVFLR